MPQINVAIVSRDNLEKSITLIVDSKRVEYFIGDRYNQAIDRIKVWLKAGWTNYTVSMLTIWAHEIKVVERRGYPIPLLRDRKENMSTSIEHKNTPSKEFSFTIIAPQAKTMHYADERKWFKTQDDAHSYAASIYDNAGERKVFDLCIVQCIDVVGPKPQIELTSRWSSTAA